MSITMPSLLKAPHHYRKTKLYGALVFAFSAVSAGSALAMPNHWYGPGDITTDEAWEAGVVQADGANVINSLSPPAPWSVTSANSYFSVDYGLYIGHGQSGELNIIANADASSFSLQVGSNEDPDMPPLTLDDPLFRVGDAGGTGSMLIDLSTPPSSEGGSRMSTNSTGLGVGLSAGSSGLVDLLGSGKSAEQLSYNSPNGFVFSYPQQNTVIGQLGGQGHINIEGAGLVFQTGEANYPGSSEPLKYFAVGDGAGGVGSVDILGNGKLASGSPVNGDTSQKGDLLPFSFIGKDAGVGAINVGVTTGGFANQADFYTGLAVGTNGGDGALNILEGGKSLINNGIAHTGSSGYCQASDSSQYPIAAAPLQISADNSSAGLVRATGSGTQLLVAGKSHNDYNSIGSNLIQEHSIGKVQIGSGGQLITAANAIVKVGVNRFYSQTSGTGSQYFVNSFQGGLGPIDVFGAGSVVYGSETGAAVAPGSIEASQINLNASTAQLQFNHTGNLNFNLPVVGSGKLLQQSGTTVIAASLAGLPELDPSIWRFDTQAPCIPGVVESYPSNQAGFTGNLDVQGGTLVLPATDVLPAITATHISGGTLAQGGTNQNLGAVTQSGGVLQLTSGSATDTATASNWAGGGGVVQLDTVLGADGSDSDQLQITGAISGTTLLNISNVGGTGAQTTGNGILVVQTDSPNAANSFVLANGPLVAGGFQYALRQVDNNWYLASSPYVGPPIATVKPVPSLSWLSLLGLSGLLAALASRITRRRLQSPNR